MSDSKDEPDVGENVVQTEFGVDAGGGAKLKVCNSFLDKGAVYVTLETSVSGVSLPSHLMRDPEVKLKFDHRFNPGDLVCDSAGIRATLRFSHAYHPCKVPWSAVRVLARRTEDARNSIIEQECWPSDYLMLAAQREALARMKAQLEDPDEGNIIRPFG